MEIPEWDGKSDRRSIPLHILNYVDERLETHTDKIYNLLADHVKEEMSRFDEIKDGIRESEERQEHRHSSLIQSITAYMQKQELIDLAFLADRHGQPDYQGHRSDHEYRKAAADWWQKVKGTVTIKVLEWASVGFFAWLMYVVWEAFLRGPHDHL